MTPQQEKAVARFRSYLQNEAHGHLSHTYEIKRFEVTDHDPLVFVSAVLGGIGDEGTNAEVFCRDYWHLKIGPRGSTSNLSGSKKKHRGMLAYIFGRES